MSKDYWIHMYKEVLQNKYWNKFQGKVFQRFPEIPDVYQMIELKENEEPYLLEGNFILNEKRGCLVYINQEKINNQKKVLNYLLKEIGKSLFSGKSIIGISLPVFIFESNSYLESLTRSLSFAPYFLEKAGKEESIVEQMNLCIAFLKTRILMFLNLEKPFNPILGETFQCEVNGCLVYCEQISHHPPITSIQMYGKGFNLCGNLEEVAQLNLNSVDAVSLGVIKISFFNTGQEFYSQGASINLCGTAFGERSFNTSGKLMVWNWRENLFCEVTYNPEKKLNRLRREDYYLGGVYKVKESFRQEFEKMKKKLYHKGIIQFQGIQDNQIENKISVIEGIWHQEIKIGNKVYWNRKQPYPAQVYYETNPLASDSNFREDILAMRFGDMELCQREKEKLENIQRNDRKLREKHLKNQDLKNKQHK